MGWPCRSRFSVYLLGMKGRSNSDFRYVLDVWQARQKADGTLVSVLAIATVVPVIRFLISPGLASAWIMGIFLFAVCMACVRLLNSAAMVVKLRESSQVRAVPQIVDAEILDVYEHPGGLEFQSGQSTTAFWLAAPGRQFSGQSSFTPQQQFVPQSPQITDGRLGYGSRRARR